MQSTVVRKATLVDAQAIAEVQFKTWQIAYRGHIPDHALDKISLADRIQQWQKLFTEQACNVLVLEIDKTIIGFVSYCPSRDDDTDPTQTAEISAIYLLSDYWQQGFGKMLLEAAEADIKKLNYKKLILWVLASNQPARKFYEKMNFDADKVIDNQDHLTNVVLKEVRYRKNIY